MVFVPVELGVWLARWRLQLSAGAEQQVEPYFGSLILAASSPSSSRAVSSVQSALVCVPAGGLVPECHLPAQPIHKYNLVVTKRLVARSRSRRALERKALLRQLSLPGSVFGFFFSPSVVANCKDKCSQQYAEGLLLLHHAEECLVRGGFLPSSLVHFQMPEGILRLLQLHFTLCLYEAGKKKNPLLCQVFLERTSFVDNSFHVLPAPWCVKATEESSLPRMKALRDQPSSSHLRHVKKYQCQI